MPIKFLEMEVREVKIPLRFAYRHASNSHKFMHHLIIRLRTNFDHDGYGEIAVRPYVTGETTESALSALKDCWWPALKAIEFSDCALPTKLLHPLYLEADQAGTPGSYAGLDIAVHDALAKSKGVPVYKLFSGRPPPVAYTAPIGMGRYPGLVSRIFKWLGFNEFKVKVGDDKDIKRVAQIRSIIGSNRDIRVDANGAWDEQTAVSRCKELARFKISKVEQPVASGNLEAMARIQKDCNLPVMADESLCTLSDARELVRHKAAKIWNIRLAKNGGFTGAKEFIALAEKENIKVQMGAMVGETTLLAVASFAARGLGEFIHHEYAFPKILLSADPFKGVTTPFGINLEKRYLAGLDVKLRSRILDRFTVNKWLL